LPEIDVTANGLSPPRKTLPLIVFEFVTRQNKTKNTPWCTIARFGIFSWCQWLRHTRCVVRTHHLSMNYIMFSVC